MTTLQRRRTLLVEMQRRQKVGGIIDRRFGEDNPSISLEEKAVQRFVRAKQTIDNKASIFNLEEDDGNAVELTHLGQSLSFNSRGGVDDFDEVASDFFQGDKDSVEGGSGSRKRRKLSPDDDDAEVQLDARAQDPFDRPRTKQEIMKEVIAKSKLHKYERQKAKEDDEELRLELDKGLAEVYALMRGNRSKPAHPPESEVATAVIQMNPDRAALLNGKDRAEADKEYDERLRQMAFDARSKPTVRTKTEEERLIEEAQRLRMLEEGRLVRMRGDDKSSGDEEEEGEEEDNIKLRQTAISANAPPSEHNEVNLNSTQRVPNQLGIEDEDDFMLDEDLIASGSDMGFSDEDQKEESQVTLGFSPDDEEEESIQGLLSKEDAGRIDLLTEKHEDDSTRTSSKNADLAFTYPCPQSHKELLDTISDAAMDDLPLIIQRIRALYHPKLDDGNKAKLGTFAGVLVDHLSYLPNQVQRPRFALLTKLIRHIHSLAKAFPVEVGRAFRANLGPILERPTGMKPGDLVLCTAIGSIFPTSDHFHPVVSPTMLTMSRYLNQKIPQNLGDVAKGVYLGTLAIQYQCLSKRYIPEAINFTLNLLHNLSPLKPQHPCGDFPHHDAPPSLRIGSSGTNLTIASRQLHFWDTESEDDGSSVSSEILKVSLLETSINLVENMAELWFTATAFLEIFDPFILILSHLLTKSCCSKLLHSTKVNILLQNGTFAFHALTSTSKSSGPATTNSSAFFNKPGSIGGHWLFINIDR